MFNFFKRSREPEYEIDPNEQAVIIDINFGGLEEFGEKDDQKAIYQLEDSVEEALPEGAELDGHEFGEGTATIYIYGPSADSIFRVIEETLKKSPFNLIDVTLRYGPAEDDNAKEKKFSL